MERENDIKYQLTPKGFLAMQLVHYGINFWRRGYKEQ